MRKFYNIGNYLPISEFIVRLKQDGGLECETNIKNTMPAHLGSFF